MGKVRRLRKKYHLACQKSESTEPDVTAIPVVPVVRSVPGLPEVPLKLQSDSTNIFAGVTISLSDLKQTLLPPTTQVLGSVSEPSVVGSKAGKSAKHVPKKEKRLARREALLRKIDTVNKLKQEAKQARKKKKQMVPKPMLMQSLIDALPLFSVKDEQKLPSEDKSKKGGKTQCVKACPSKKKRKKDYLENLKAYKTVLSNKHYKADPAAAITNYLLRTVSQNSSWARK